jgi:hypothetical protein
MGAWGTGLYANDVAADMRGTIAAMARLPFSGEELLGLLRQSHAGTADDPGDEDHTVFWLVVADQFRKLGIVAPEATGRALDIIDSGHDLAVMAELGMSKADLAKRRQVLTDLRTSLVSGTQPARPRKVLKKPLPAIMATGDAITYPTMRGAAINPHFPSKEAQNWQTEGWAAFVVIDSGSAFDFLPWYKLLVVGERRPFGRSGAATPYDVGRITSEAVSGGGIGTCSPTHFRKMELQKIGTLDLDPAKVAALWAEIAPKGYGDGTRQALNDISIANALLPAMFAEFPKGMTIARLLRSPA